MKPLLTAAQVAEAFQVDESTIRSWARAGRIPSFKLGPGVVRFDPDLLEGWLGGRMVGDPTSARPATPARATI